MDHSPIPKPEFLKRQITISTINKQFESKSILKKEPQQQPQIIDIATEDKSLDLTPDKSLPIYRKSDARKPTSFYLNNKKTM